MFVATSHILPEVIEEQPPTWPEIGLLVAGAIAPAFLNVEHGH